MVPDQEHPPRDRLCGGTRPIPIPQEEVDVILQQLERGPAPVIKTKYERGENVRITDGPFSSFIGYMLTRSTWIMEGCASW